MIGLRSAIAKTTWDVSYFPLSHAGLEPSFHEEDGFLECCVGSPQRGQPDCRDLRLLVETQFG